QREEQHGIGQQIFADREHLGEPAAQGNHDDLGDQIGGRDPAAVVDTGADGALDVRERGVDDLDVEHGHEGAERRTDHCDPGLQGNRGGDHRRCVVPGGRGSAAGGNAERRCQWGHRWLLLRGKWTMRQAACFDNPERRERIVQRGGIVLARQEPPVARVGAMSDATRACASRSASTVALVFTVGTVDMPGRSRPLRRWSSSTIFTGTRCTILVKLPVALSGGSSANSRPLAGDRLSTWPFNFVPWKLSILSSTGWPLRTFVSCVSLKFAIT